MAIIEKFDGQVVHLRRDGDAWFASIDAWQFQSSRHGNKEAAFSEARRYIKARAKEIAENG